MANGEEITATTTSGATEQIQEAASVLGELDSIYDELETITDSAEKQSVVPEQFPPSSRLMSFSAQEPSMWMLWAILFGILILLLAIRRFVLRLAVSEGEISSFPAIGIPKTNPSGTTDQHTQAPLVKPVKLVKIKVRKISRTKTHE